ncbi:MAG: DUF3463 domain-containing protein [Chthoniobacteraceae bacterium]|nr:DUF3463 domain-containing protein [Chthoniobacteraceae bacterium]
MRFPLPLTLKIARTILGRRLRGTDHFATVLQLEPLHACNLACPGCGRIREYAASVKEMMPLQDCLAAAAECDAPMVSLCGGEPLLYPRVAELVSGLRAQGRIVYLCTNALLMRQKLGETLAERWRRDPAQTDGLVDLLVSEDLLSAADAETIRHPRAQPAPPVIESTRWFFWNIHLDGLETSHDRSVKRQGVFREAVQAIRMAKLLGFQVATNTTVYQETDMAEIEDLFVFLGSLGVDGHTLSPGYGFAEARRSEDEFLTRQAVVKKFRCVEDWGRRYPLFGTPVYLEFLAGKRELACSAWAIPTRNVRGWRGPCYLIADAHYASYAEMLAATDWGRFASRQDSRCEHCMVHCGFEPTASLGIGARRGDLLKNIWFQFGPRPRVKLHPVHAYNSDSASRELP